MKAAIINNFGSPDVFKIEELPEPVPASNEVLVEVKASSVNPVDWKSRKGHHRLILGAPFPIVLGYDLAGIVKKTGKNITRFKPGDRVYGRSDKKYGGAYAELAVTSEYTLAMMPKELNFEEAAAIPLACLTALQGLRDKAGLKKEDRVLIIGASGGVGHFALQCAKIFGANITAVASYRHEDYIKKLQPDFFIDYTKEDFRKSVCRYQCIFDAVGKESFLTVKHLLDKNGIYITLLPRPKILLHKFLSLFTEGKKVKTFLMKSNYRDLKWVNKHVENGNIIPRVDKVFRINEIAEAHRYSEKGHAGGKIIVSM